MDEIGAVFFGVGCSWMPFLQTNTPKPLILGWPNNARQEGAGKPDGEEPEKEAHQPPADQAP